MCDECCLCLDPCRPTRSTVTLACCNHATLHARCFQRLVVSRVIEGHASAQCPLCRSNVPPERCGDALAGCSNELAREAVRAALLGALQRRLDERRELLAMQFE